MFNSVGHTGFGALVTTTLEVFVVGRTVDETLVTGWTAVRLETCMHPEMSFVTLFVQIGLVTEYTFVSQPFDLCESLPVSVTRRLALLAVLDVAGFVLVSLPTVFTDKSFVWIAVVNGHVGVECRLLGE